MKEEKDSSKQAPAMVDVFLCDCGHELSRVIDFGQLEEHVSNIKSVKSVRKCSFLCSDLGLNELKAVAKNGAQRLVIAACSPKLYEPLFRQSLKAVDFDPFMLEMANIREQCAWPNADDSLGATEKAKRLVEAAVAKAQMIESVGEQGFDIEKAVLVIGAGVAGLQAAIDAGDFGHKVTLIEKEPVIGGNALKLGLAFPTDDGAFCISPSKLVPSIRKCFYRVGLLQHPNIKVRTLSEVEEVNGSCGNFNVKIMSNPRGVDQRLCTNCGKCAEVCPVEIANAFNYGLNKRKAIYLPHPNAVPPVYVIDWKSCTKCGKCAETCPAHAVDLYEKSTQTKENFGAIVIATGFQEYDPSGIKQYKYSVDKDVITQLELSRILDPFGPTGGQLVKPSDGKPPKRITMVQCVGSRDTSTNAYCSKICCMVALKHSILIKETYGRDVEVYFCYMDIRTPGKGYEEYFSRARALGVTFIRGKPSEIYRDPSKNCLIVDVEDTILNMPLELETDLAVLSVAMRPTKGIENLTKALGVEVDCDGFVKEVYPKLRQTETNVKGIYVCGGAQAPKDIPESVTQAEAVAFHVISDLSKKTYQKSLDIAFVKEEACDGCKICVDACPFDAIEIVEVEKTADHKSSSVARINAIRCDRCGTCSGRCPTGAIQLRRYTDDQAMNQISALLSPNNGILSPKIVAFCCDECGYATVDLVGMGKIKYPANILPVRTPCLNWISPYHIFKTFEHGADGVLLVGCKIGKCQHLNVEANAEKTVKFAKDIMDEIGLNGDRLEMISVCAAEPTRFTRAAESLVSVTKKIGPVPKNGILREDLSKQVMKEGS